MLIPSQRADALHSIGYGASNNQQNAVDATRRHGRVVNSGAHKRLDGILYHARNVMGKAGGVLDLILRS